MLGQLLSALWQALGLLDNPAVKVGLLPNGASWRVAPTVVTGGSWDDLRKQVEGSELKGLGKDWWLADPDGTRVNSWPDVLALPEAKRTLNVVPEGRPFQWGARRAGERFPVKVKGWEGVEMETVATTPGIFLIHNLFSEEEAMFLIDRATKRTGQNALQTSGIGLGKDGQRAKAAVRTSSNAFDAESPGAVELIRRAFDVLRVNHSMPMADGLQILRYELGQAYISHTDWFPVRSDSEHNFDPTTPGGSNRYATVFLYLWPPPTGGYTVFPKATIEEDMRSNEFVSIGDDPELMEEQLRLAREHYKDSTWEVEITRDCYSKLAVKPVRLGAALFYHQEPMTGRLLREAQHGACPSLTGTKWGANLWLWNAGRIMPGAPKGAHTQVTVTFKNTHSTPLALEYSLDDQASWTLYSTLEPGAQTVANSFPNHAWRYLQDGKVVGLWAVPAGGASKVTFASSDTARPSAEL